MIAEERDEQEARKTFSPIARGVIGWRELEPFGVTAQLDRMPATYSESWRSPDVLVTVDDLRHGYSTPPADPRGLRQWAKIMMCGCSDLEPVDNDPEGEADLDALSSLAFGEPPASDVLARPAGVGIG